MRDFLHRWNWWKIAFFAMLLLFELTRELYVSKAAEGHHIGGYFSVLQYDGYTRATGRWRRIDDGGDLLPTAVSIVCREQAGNCEETSSMVLDGWTQVPETDVFPATFAPGLITYENASPACATYRVRIDTRAEQVVAVRTKTEPPPKTECNALENRIEMRLGDGYESGDTYAEVARISKEHFLPLIALLRFALD